MRSILDITLKDLVQLVRNKMTFLFLLVMPIIFTLLFGFAFGGFGSQSSEQRFPVGYLDLDKSESSLKLADRLTRSAIFYLEDNPDRSKPELESLVSRKALAAAVLVPEGFGESSSVEIQTHWLLSVIWVMEPLLRLKMKFHELQVNLRMRL